MRGTVSRHYVVTNLPVIEHFKLAPSEQSVYHVDMVEHGAQPHPAALYCMGSVKFA